MVVITASYVYQPQLIGLCLFQGSCTGLVHRRDCIYGLRGSYGYLRKTCTNPGRQRFRMEKWATHSSTPTLDLPAAAGCLRKEKSTFLFVCLFSGVWTHLCFWCSKRWSYIHIQLSSHTWIQLGYKEKNVHEILKDQRNTIAFYKKGAWKVGTVHIELSLF